MKELNELRKRLLKQVSSEQESVYTLCAVMEKVGGYSELLNLPIPTLNQIIKYLEFINREEEKAINKHKFKK